MIVTKELVDEINQYFKDRGFRWLSVNAVASADGDDTLISEIYNGDWKHDHLAIDRLVDEFFNNHPTLEIKDTRREDYEGSEGDWYSETHLWEIGEKSNENIEETDIMEKLTKEQLRAYSDKRMSKSMNEATLLEFPNPFKSKDKRQQDLQAKIIKEFKNAGVSSEYRFFIDGSDKPLTWSEAMKKNLTDEQIVNAVVVKPSGLYVRRGTEYVKKPTRYSKASAAVSDEYKYVDPDVKQAEKDQAAADKAKSKQVSKLPKSYQDWVFMIKEGDSWKSYTYSQFSKLKLSNEQLEDVIVTDKKASVKVPYADAAAALNKSREDEDQRLADKDARADAKDAKDAQTAEDNAFKASAKDASGGDGVSDIKKSEFVYFDGDTPTGEPLTWKEYKKLPPKLQKLYKVKYKGEDGKDAYLGYDELRARFSKLTASYDRQVVDRMLSESYAKSRRGMIYDDDFSPVSRDVDYQGFDRIDDDFC